MNFKRYFLSFGSLSSILISVVGLIVGNLPLLLLGIVAWVGYFAFRVIFHDTDSQKTFSLDDLSPELRLELRPFQSSIRNIQETLRKNASSSWIKTITGEALNEASQIFDASKQLLIQKQQLSRIQRSSSLPSDEIAEQVLSIDQKLSAAHEALKDLEAKLIGAAVSPTLQSTEEEDFQQMLLRLKSLGVTLEESRQLFERQSHGTQ